MDDKTSDAKKEASPTLPPSNKSMSFLNPIVLKSSARLLFGDGDKYNDIPIETFVEDIEKFKSDYTIKFSVKMRYLKLLVEVIHLAHNDVSTLWNKTVTLIIEILSKTVIDAKDKVFHEFAGACLGELMRFGFQKVQNTQILLSEYAKYYLETEKNFQKTKNSTNDRGFNYQVMSFEFFLDLQDIKQCENFLDFFYSVPEKKQNAAKIFSNTLAKHLDELSRFNVYNQASILDHLEKSPTLSFSYGHLLKLGKTRSNCTDPYHLFYDLKIILSLKKLGNPSWEAYLNQLASIIIAECNSAHISNFYKKILLLLICHIKEHVHNSSENEDPHYLLLPYENYKLKMDEIFVYFLYNSREIFFEHVSSILNHFQNFKTFSSDSIMSKDVWKLIEFLLFRFPSRDCVDSIIETIFSFFEFKPMLNKMFVNVLKKLCQSEKDIDLENYEYLCDASKKFLLKKHPSDLIQYIPIIIYFIEENYTDDVLEILKNLKKFILYNKLEENQFLIAGSNFIYLIKMVLKLYHQYKEFPVDELANIMTELLDLNDIYIRDEALTLLRMIQVLPKQRYLEFLSPTKNSIQKSEYQLSFEGYSETQLTTDQLHRCFMFEINKTKRIEKGILDKGSAFSINSPQKELNLQPIESLSPSKQSKLERVSSENFGSITHIHTIKDLHSFFNEIFLRSSSQQDLYCLSIQFQKNIMPSDTSIIPNEIYNIELLTPNDSIVKALTKIHIPYLQSSESKKEINLILILNSCIDGIIDIGISFTDQIGNIFFGVFKPVDWKFRDCFLKVELPLYNFNVTEFEVMRETVSDEEILGLSYYFFLLQNIKGIIKSIRTIKQPMEKVLEKFENYLGYFRVHNQYEIKGNDDFGQEIWQLNYPSEPYPESEDTVLIEEEKQIARTIIKLPSGGFLLMRFSFHKAMTLIRIHCNSYEILQYIDEYFDDIES